jgi:hypothetical protein
LKFQIYLLAVVALTEQGGEELVRVDRDFHSQREGKGTPRDRNRVKEDAVGDSRRKNRDIKVTTMSHHEEMQWGGRQGESRNRKGRG